VDLSCGVVESGILLADDPEAAAATIARFDRLADVLRLHSAPTFFLRQTGKERVGRWRGLWRYAGDVRRTLVAAGRFR
jgi:hypothetical protein